MSGTFEKSSRRTSRDSRNATSSLESEFGVMPFAEPDGQTVIPFGQGAAHANLSVRAGKGEASPIRVICGPHGSGSSASVALALSLGSRLHQKMAWRGSTLFHLTSKMEATPLGRRYWALRGSARRTSATGCGSWPTPNRPTGGPNTESTETHTGGRDLDGAAKLAGWPTPQSHDERERGNTEADHHHFPHDPSNAAQMASWASPRATDGEKGGPNQRGSKGDLMLPSQAVMASWATPNAGDWAGGKISPSRKEAGTGISLKAQVMNLAASGGTPTGSPAATEKPGQLKPSLSRWLQGLPVIWDLCAARIPKGKKGRAE